VEEISKPIFKQRLERLQAMIDELGQPAWYYAEPIQFGFMNGLLTAMAVLNEKDLRNVMLKPPSEDTLKRWESLYAKKEEIHNERQDHSNNQCKRGPSDSSESHAAQKLDGKDPESDARGDSSNSHRSQSGVGSEETRDDSQESNRPNRGRTSLNVVAPE
jgi:hypothetical protein